MIIIFKENDKQKRYFWPGNDNTYIGGQSKEKEKATTKHFQAKFNQ